MVFVVNIMALYRMYSSYYSNVGFKNHKLKNSEYQERIEPCEYRTVLFSLYHLQLIKHHQLFALVSLMSNSEVINDIQMTRDFTTVVVKMSEKV